MIFNNKIKSKTVIEGLIALLIPIIYFFMLGGFNSSGTNKQSYVPYNPLSVITKDFIDEIINGRFETTSESGDSDLSPNIKRLINSQRLVFNVLKTDSCPNELYFKTINGYREINKNGKNVLYLSSGSYADSREPLKKGYIAADAGGLDFLLSYDTLSSFEWYLKPKMKIRKGDFSPFDTRPVCAVITTGFSGNVIDSTIIRVRNFSEMSGKYEGDYCERYMTENEMPGDNMRISSKELFKHGSKTNTGFNIRIYWFGELDLWFEKLTMDDYMANRLLDGSYYELIVQEASYSILNRVAEMVKQKKLTDANYIPVNYVMNVMYNNLQNSKVLP